MARKKPLPASPAPRARLSAEYNAMVRAMSQLVSPRKVRSSTRLSRRQPTEAPVPPAPLPLPLPLPPPPMSLSPPPVLLFSPTRSGSMSSTSDKAHQFDLENDESYEEGYQDALLEIMRAIKYLRRLHRPRRSVSARVSVGPGFGGGGGADMWGDDDDDDDAQTLPSSPSSPPPPCPTTPTPPPPQLQSRRREMMTAVEIPPTNPREEDRGKNTDSTSMEVKGKSKSKSKSKRKSKSKGKKSKRKSTSAGTSTGTTNTRDSSKSITVSMKSSTSVGVTKSRQAAHTKRLWEAAQRETGMCPAVTRGMYINGEVTVGGQQAATVVRENACDNCARKARVCLVRDTAREKLVTSDSCGWCLRLSVKCGS